MPGDIREFGSRISQHAVSLLFCSKCPKSVAPWRIVVDASKRSRASSIVPECDNMLVALRTIEDIRRRGVPLGEEVPFGHVVPCPLPPYAPLAVVQPQEGLKLAADSETRYE